MRTIGSMRLILAPTLAVAACAAPADPASEAPDSTPPSADPPSPEATAGLIEPSPTDAPSDAEIATCAEGVICDGILLPGTYETDALGPTIRFAVAEPWLGTTPSARSLELQRPGAADGLPPQALAFARFDGTVFEPTCPDTAEPTEVDASARGFMDHLVGLPAVTPDADPVPISVGGAEGWVLDATLAADQGCELPLVLLFGFDDAASWGSVDGEDARFVAVDVGDTTILILVETFPGGDHADLLDAAAPVLESISFEAGG